MYNINSKYQLVLIGGENPFKDTIVETFKNRLKDLGLVEDSVVILDESNFIEEYLPNSPAVGLYFGVQGESFPNEEIAEMLVSHSKLVLPIIDDLKKFNDLIPLKLRRVNGFLLNLKSDIESLVSSILEGFRLLRLERRLFISYRRTESKAVAIQLFEKFEEAGFDVFLDTHTLKPGDPVLEEIWHRLVDTDVLVLLDTPGFLESPWTKDELAKASLLSIGILQIVWPNSPSSIKKNVPISIPVNLKEADFVNSNLADTKVNEITSLVESLRARNLAARQNNIIHEFIKTAESLNVTPTLQRENFITIEKDNNTEYVLIPTIGVPHAFTYNQKQELIKIARAHKTTRAFLLFDNTLIKKQWLLHLDWLNEHLPIKSVPFKESEKWLKENIL